MVVPEDVRVLGSVLRIHEIPLTDAGQVVHAGPSGAAVFAAPHVKLWLVGEHVDLNAHCDALLAADQAPYWAFCWGGGQALARFIHADPSWVAGKHVVDFGAGSGVAGIAARLAGAARVTAVDIAANARAFCRHNAALNGVELEVAAELPAAADVVLAADVLYHVGNLSLLERLRSRAQTVLVADPQRPGTPRVERAPVRRYDIRTVPDVDYPIQQAAIYAF